jgi:hypothetical protein
MNEFAYLDSPNPQLFARQDAGDESLMKWFYMGVIQNQGRTTEEGRPIFDDVECIKIITPGDKNSVIDRPASADDKRRFSKEYAAFKEGKKEDEQIGGTPLTEWPFLSRAQVEEFKYLGLRTVEQLAECRDDVTSRVPGLVSIKRNAQVWLGKTKSASEAAKTAKLIEDQASQISTLQEAVRQQAQRLEMLTMPKAA